MQRLSVDAQAQLEREGSLPVHLEAGAVPAVGAAAALGARGEVQHLVRLRRVRVLVPLGVHRVVRGEARLGQRPPRHLHPAEGFGLVLDGA
jgi:hypothetical protein